MERVIVSLSRPSEGKELDMEMPIDLPVGALIQEIALAMGWGDQGEIYADPPGRVLHPHETLAQARVWDGARLLFQEQGGFGSPPFPPPPSSPPSPSPGVEGPVRGWRPLDPGQPSPSTAPDTPSPPSSGGFVWRQVDED